MDFKATIQSRAVSIPDPSQVNMTQLSLHALSPPSLRKSPGTDTYRAITDENGSSTMNIFNSQYNIAREIYERWNRREQLLSIMKDKKKFD